MHCNVYAALQLRTAKPRGYTKQSCTLLEAVTAKPSALEISGSGAVRDKASLTPHSAVLLQEALCKDLVICHRPIGREHDRRHPIPELHLPRPGAMLCDEGRAAVQRREAVACSQAADSTSEPLPP